MEPLRVLVQPLVDEEIRQWVTLSVLQRACGVWTPYREMQDLSEEEAGFIRWLRSRLIRGEALGSIESGLGFAPAEWPRELREAWRMEGGPVWEGVPTPYELGRKIFEGRVQCWGSRRLGLAHAALLCFCVGIPEEVLERSLGKRWRYWAAKGIQEEVLGAVSLNLWALGTDLTPWARDPDTAQMLLRALTGGGHPKLSVDNLLRYGSHARILRDMLKQGLRPTPVQRWLGPTPCLWHSRWEPPLVFEDWVGVSELRNPGWFDEMERRRVNARKLTDRIPFKWEPPFPYAPSPPDGAAYVRYPPPPSYAPRKASLPPGPKGA